MELHETYSTLIRRGMGEHERLWWCEPRPLSMTRFEPFWALPPSVSGSHVQKIHEDDARDLIEAHALRWWQSIPDRAHGVIMNPGGPVVCDDLSDGGDVKSGAGPTILDAILVATEHLEPASTSR